MVIPLTRTPFYAEKGGQVGDTGVLEGVSGRFKVEDTLYPAGNLVVHRGKVLSGTLSQGDVLKVQVDEVRRKDIARNHTATHLLHESLVCLLGDHVRQAGSLVGPDFLRFDFTHFEGLPQRDLDEVELFVNQAIWKNIPLDIVETTLDDAKSRGAKALFGEKYGQDVRVVAVGDTSIELCGGIHVNATGEIGSFKILREESVGAGTRRITAVTGMEALKEHQKLQRVVETLRQNLGCEAALLHEKVEELQKNLRDNENLLKKERLESSLSKVESLVENAVNVNGVSVVKEIFPGGQAEDMLQVADAVRQRLSSVVIVFAGCHEGRVQFVAVADDNAVSRGIHAGKIVKEVAKLTGGGGGGKAQMAQAGGKKPEKTEEALGVLPGLCATLLEQA